MQVIDRVRTAPAMLSRTTLAATIWCTTCHTVVDPAQARMESVQEVGHGPAPGFIEKSLAQVEFSACPFDLASF